MVEGGEVVVVELDLGAFEHLVAEPDEDVLDLAPGAGQQVQVADRDRRRPGQGHVDRLGAQRALDLGRLELRATRLRARPRAPRGRRLPPPRPARARRVRARRSRAGSRSARTCGRDSGPAAARARRRRARRRSPRRPRRAGCRSAPTSGGRRYPSQGDRRRGGDVQRLRAPASQRDRPAPLATGEDPVRQPLALGAETERSPARGRPGPRRRARPAPPAAPGFRSIAPRATGWLKIEPMLARTACPEYGSAQPGPSTTTASTSASVVRMIAPTLRGSRDRVQVDARAGGAALPRACG